MNTHYTLSQLCVEIETVLTEGLEPTYWVQAEISSLSEKGGHLYLELIDAGDNSKSRSKNSFSAKVRATCWQGMKEMLMTYFESETGQHLQVGMRVLVEAEVQFHPVYGLSLSIVGIDPGYTIGELALQRQKTIVQLEADGLMDAQQMLALPTLIKNIAVISSASAAGYGDFSHQLENSGYRFKTGLFGAIMQGDGAEKSIIAALDAIETDEEKWDVVAIIRGGGATSDLNCFDNYTLCAVCAQFSLPIISGIGHTRDVSVLDLVAHEALKTPTAVAEWLIHRMDDQMARIEDLRNRLSRTFDRQIMIRRHRIELLEQRMLTCNPERIYQRGYSLLTKNGKIVRSVDELSAGEKVLTHLADGCVQSIVEK